MKIRKIAFIIFLVVYLTAPPTFGSIDSNSIKEEYSGIAKKESISLGDYREMIDYVKKHGLQEPVYHGTRYYIKLVAPDHIPPKHIYPYTMVVEFNYVTGPASGVNITAFGKIIVQDTKVPTYLFSHLYMDDADEDMYPNSIVQVNVRTEDNIIVFEEYKSISKAHSDWDYFLRFVYGEFIKGGM